MGWAELLWLASGPNWCLFTKPSAFQISVSLPFSTVFSGAKQESRKISAKKVKNWKGRAQLENGHSGFMETASSQSFGLQLQPQALFFFPACVSFFLFISPLFPHKFNLYKQSESPLVNVFLFLFFPNLRPLLDPVGDLPIAQSFSGPSL